MCLARRLWSSAPARAALGLVLVVAVLAAFVAGFGLPPFATRDTSKESAGPTAGVIDLPGVEAAPPPRLLPKVPPTPGILTVSEKWDDGGQYRTIQEALAAVKPGEVIRVLDDASYEGGLRLDDAAKYRDVTLEAVRGATLSRNPTGGGSLIKVTGAERVAIRGFKLRLHPHGGREGVRLTLGKHCSAVRLEELEILDGGLECEGVWIDGVGGFEPTELTRIDRCTFAGCRVGIAIGGMYSTWSGDQPSVANVCVVDNRFLNTSHPISLRGRFDSILVAGNRFKLPETDYADPQFKPATLGEAPTTFAFTFEGPYPDNKNVLIANNTIDNAAMFGRVFQDWGRPIGGQVRVTGNLLLGSGYRGQVAVKYYDSIYLKLGTSRDAPRSYGSTKGARTLTKLWTFSHNWRETDQLKDPPPEVSTGVWWSPTEQDKEIMRKEELSLDVQGIPASTTTHLVPVIEGIDRDPKSPTYLRPAAKSPVATAGDGRDDLALPKYVGAVPPEGVPAWDWNRTWEAMKQPRPPEKTK